MPTGSGDEDDRDSDDPDSEARAREALHEKIEKPAPPREGVAARKPFSLALLTRSNDPRARLRFAIAGGGMAALVVMFAACGACGRRQAATSGDAATKPTGSNEAAALRAGEADASPSASLLWANAKDGDAEDLAALAAHEGAAGLVEATIDPSLRPTAIRAMAYARGWAQLPFLSRVAGGKDDTEARLALDATIDLAARPRVSEDPEDADELKEGCEGLLALARDVARARVRRVLALRALRMMPCPKADFPADVDAK